MILLNLRVQKEKITATPHFNSCPHFAQFDFILNFINSLKRKPHPKKNRVVFIF